MLFEIPGYHLEEKVSENAAFRIFRGQRLQDREAVLIKVLQQPYPTPKLVAPLWQEYEILRQLDFPGVEKALSLENHQQWWMIVLEDFGGRPLDGLRIAGKMEPDEFLKLAIQLADIIKEIHARQVIHKNISPANIYYNRTTGQARLANFEAAALVSNEKVPLRSPHQLFGFLPYISPEMTGRMNRTVDYRTDYYSLGAALYELLTGTPPFPVESPLELVHAHLAIPPDPPGSRIELWKDSPAAFEILSAILMKLLAKNPEDRYQTADGLLADLRQCLSALQDSSHSGLLRQAFVPGHIDRPAELNIPQLVIGREKETEQLLQAFLRTVGGPGELVLVSGEDGVGKTTLVNQLIHPVTERQGLFLYAKFDQDHPLNIYHGLAEMLGEFCRLVLAEPRPAFEAWRERVQAALAPHGKLLMDLCPQLEKIIGPQPPVEPVDEGLARPRLHQLVIRFLQAICRPEHPVVIFLDELQWINWDSSLMWQSILSTPSLHDLLIVGAYRDNEIGPDYPIHLLMSEVGTATGRVTRLGLKNLEWSQIHRLVAAALASDAAEISDLATLVYLRTEGNPYFSIELLKSIYKDQLLAFNLKAGKWQWDAARIEEYGVASNVVDLFIHEIANLDEDTQRVLQVAACIGRRFDAATLLDVVGQDKASSLAYSLWQAMTEGLIQPLDENYRFLAGENIEGVSGESDGDLPSLADLIEEEIHFEFQHDRVQQAVLDMLDERQLRQISLQIAWLLLEKAERRGKEAVQEALLAIVDHLNTGSALIEDLAKAVKAAQLNLMASSQARLAAAFEAASTYLSAGIQFLPLNSWQDHYTLTLELFTAGAEIALLNGDLASAEALALAAEANARTLLDKARGMKTRMDLYVIQSQLDQAVELGIAAIEMFGFDLEDRKPLSSIREQYMHLPDMAEPRALALTRLADVLIPAAFASMDARFVQLILFFIDLFTRFGNPPGASFIYIAYAVILISQFGQVEQGCRMGKMALELAEKGGSLKTLTAVRFVYYAFIHHWMAPARDALSPLHENIQPALEAGNLLFSLNTQDLELQNSLLVGLKLGQVRSKQAEAFLRTEIFNQVGITQRMRIWSSFVLKLIGDPDEIESSLFGEDEGQALREIGQHRNRNYLFNWHIAQATLSLLFREPRRAVENSASADALKLSVGSHLIYAYHHYIHSLALCSAGLDAGDLASRLEKVEENLRLMRIWAAHVPENFLHQVELVEAEQARSLGHEDQAAAGYERAIQDARKKGYIHESALAAELAAEFYLAQGDTAAAIDHLFTAYYSYLAWGAQAKVEDLANRYSQWLPPGKHEGKRLDIYPAAEDQPNGEIGPSIDLNTILKASLELAQETDLEELLRKLMAILIQNAGAQNGSLVLWLDDRWSLEVQGSTDPHQEFAIISSPLEDQATLVGGPQVPLSIIHYVINSQVDLVLKDASASSQFSGDRYIRARRPKSILCAPLLNQGVLSGVIYLENNLAAGAFTTERLEIVQLISGQAAVSIQKARLYENLEALVKERTRELSDANRKLQDEIDERIRVEEALRLSEERYRTMFENTGTAMAVIDWDGKITLTNEEFARLTGHPREVLEAGFQSLDLVAPEDAPRIYQYHLDRLKDASLAPKSYEFQLVDRSGLEKSILNTAAVLPGSDNIILSMIDISQRKQAELELQIAMQELMQAEEELRNQYEELFETLQELAAAKTAIETERQRYLDLFDFAPDAYLVTEVDGKIFEANRAAGDLLGMREEDLTGNLLFNFLNRNDRRVFRARLAEMAVGRNSQEEPSGGKGGYGDWEVSMHKADGSPINASIAVAAVSGGQGEPISLRWLVRDISARKRAELALRESEERLRSITENAPDFIAELDLSSRFLYVNRPPAGYLLEEIIGQSIFDFIPKGYHAEVRDLLELADSSGQLQAAEFKQTLPDGIDRWQSARFVPVIWPGSEGHIVVISTDITVQKWIEQQLREAEEFTRATLNSLSEHIAILNEEGRILWVNQAWQDFSRDNSGDPAKTGVGANYLQVCEMAVGPEAEMAKKFARGIRAALSGEVDPFELEYTCSSPEEMRWFLGRVTTFSIGDSRRVVIAHDDITQLKQYELALQKSEALYRAVINTQTELVCRYLPDTTLTFVNDAYCRFTGKTAAELVGQSYLISIPQEIHAFIRQTIIGMVEHPGTQEFEQYVVSAAGELRWQRWVHSPILSNGSVVEFQAVGFDITERKKMELLLQENEARLRFALDSAQLAPFDYNILKNELVWDERTKSLWGVPAGETPGYDETFQTVHPEDRQRAELALTQAADPTGTGDFDQEFRVVWPDGSVHWISAKGKVSFIGEGEQRQPARLLGILRDITGRKAMEDLLRENEARLRIAMDAAQLAPFDFNLLTGEVVWDERINKLLSGFRAGESPDQLDYNEIMQLVHPEDRQRADLNFARAAEPGGSDDFEQELRLMWPDGSVQWISAKGKVYFDGEGGYQRATRLAGILRDITRRKQAEEALRYNEALLRKVLEILPVGVWIMDKTSRIILANPEGQRIWAGVKYVELPEYGEYKAWRVDTGERVTAEEWAGGLAVTKEQVTLNEELEIEAFDGTHRAILNSAIPLVTEEDGLVGAIVVNQDITERKRYEEELQKAHDQLATLLGISQSIVSILDLDRLLNLIIEQLGLVMPYDGAAILILQGSSLEFRVIRGPSVFQSLSKYQIPASEPTLIAPLLKEKEAFYIPDLQNQASLLLKIQNTIKLPYDQFTYLRSWLGLPLIAKDVLVGILVLAHSQPDYYSPQSRELSQAYANQVAIAIHNAQLYEQASAIAALEERNRLARELHDSVAQALYSISLFTDATRMALETNKLETVKEHLGELTQLAKEAMADMRLMIFELRPPILEKDGLVVALQSRLDSVESRTGFQAELETEGELDLSGEAQSELYRIAQEALNNVSKHAHANQVKVLLQGEAGIYRMIIEDNGVGYDPASIEHGGGQGIRNIRERADAIGAACRIESAPGKGTKIIIEVKK